MHRDYGFRTAPYWANSLSHSFAKSWLVFIINSVYQTWIVLIVSAIVGGVITDAFQNHRQQVRRCRVCAG